MSTNFKRSIRASHEKFRVALTNVETQPVIAEKMAEMGYTSDVLQEGSVYLANSLAADYRSKIERDEMKAAYRIFNGKCLTLKGIYSRLRKISKVAFRNDPNAATKLSLDSAEPGNYLLWVEAARKFFTEISGNPEYLEKLSVLQVSEEEINEGLKLIKEMEEARAVYVKEKGQSQVATEEKKAAFRKIDDWMSDFYAVAQIAFMDNPQYQEVLGKVVKS